MYQNTDKSPATAHPNEDPGTGAGQQASTAPAAGQAAQPYALASMAYLEAAAAKHRADAHMFSAMAAAHRVDPFMGQRDRDQLAAVAEARAAVSIEQAGVSERRAAELRAECPALASAPVAPMAVVVVAIHRDRVEQTARLVMGSTATATRRWTRAGAVSWQTLDPDWSAFEDRIGVELAEFMDELPMPNRVAAMLPRPPAPGSDAARQAAEEVRRG